MNSTGNLEHYPQFDITRKMAFNIILNEYASCLFHEAGMEDIAENYHKMFVCLSERNKKGEELSDLETILDLSLTEFITKPFYLGLKDDSMPETKSMELHRKLHYALLYIQARVRDNNEAFWKSFLKSLTLNNSKEEFLSDKLQKLLLSN